MSDGKNQLPFEDPFYDRLRLFLDATRAETERGRALVSASLIEQMLEEILKAFLLKNAATESLFAPVNAPFSTLSAKASACRALSFIEEEEFQDIKFVRKIRNEFAHNVVCSFEDSKIRSWAKSLKVGMSALDALEEGHKSRVDDPKSRFSMVTVSIVSSLYNRAAYVKRNSIVDRQWPA